MSLDGPSDKAVNATPLRVAVVAARFNDELVGALLQGVLAGLRAAGVRPGNLWIERVPGSNELPVASRLVIGHRRPDVVVALGVVIRGDTIHFELVARAATDALQAVALESGVPVINGVIAAENRAQARARCGGRIDRAAEFARAAVEMGALRRRLKR